MTQSFVRRAGCAALLAICTAGSPAQQAASESQAAVTASGSDEQINLDYVGGKVSIGVGFDSEFDVVGEIMGVLAESADSALIGEGWISSEGGAGGLKLNYHWLFGAESAGTDEAGNPLYRDGTVAKLFAAVDQNDHDDRKLTVGGGMEYQNFFWSVYGMAGLDDERLVTTRVETAQSLVEGTLSGHDFTRIDTIETTTRVFEEPYEWGVGARVGHYLRGPQLRLRAGFDYEDGNQGADQATVSASLDKVFGNTGHVISLRGEYANKSIARSVSSAVDDDDWRGGIFYTFNFGAAHQPAQRYKSQRVQVSGGDPASAADSEEKVAYNEVTISAEANFALDSARLRPEARKVLDDLLAKVDDGGLVSEIRIVGHTCNLGTRTYNQGLSERRARSVVDYLAGHGIDREQMQWSGRGELEPEHANETEATRRLNRRVELSFVTQRKTVKPATGPSEPVYEWKQVEVPTEAPWIRRALRNPVRHKRRVDTYRTEADTSEVTQGEPTFDNQDPQLADDSFNVEQDSSDNLLDVLANDSDPDGDSLSLVEVANPANGSASRSGDAVLYTPAPGFTGIDSFTYTIEDGFGGRLSATVTVNVQPLNAPPQASDDSAEAVSGRATQIDVLTNDTDPDGDPLSVVALTQPANGSAVKLGAGLSYTSAAGFTGTDNFTYTVEDSAGNRDTATVTVQVRDPGEPPQAMDDSAMVMMGQSVTIDVLANDLEPDGQPLTVARIEQPPPSGTATINADGTITYQTEPGFVGTVEFIYVAADPEGNEDSATVSVMVGAD